MTLTLAAGLNPTQLARALRSLAAEQGLSLSCDPTTVRRWLAGTQPRPPAPALLLECLSRRLGRPVSAKEAGLTHTPAVAVDPAWEADPLRNLARLTGFELDPARQSLLGANGFSLAATVVPDQITFTPAPVQPASEGPLPAPPLPAVTDGWHGMAQVFHAAAEQYGGELVRAALAAFLAHRVIPVLHSQVHDRNRQAVLSAAAQLTLLLGNMSVDCGHDRTAQHYHRIAARLAADAGDPATLAIALRTMATHAYQLGHHTPAVLRLSEQAVTHAHAAPSAVQAYAQAHYAVLLSYYDRSAALSTLASAERLHARADAAPGPFTAYPVGALYYQRAQALSILGDQPGSMNALNTSLRLRTAAEYRAAGLTRAKLAEIHFSIGHLEQALAHWQAFLNAYPVIGPARATRHLQTMRRQLRHYPGHQAASQLLAQANLLG
ncbi:hypothetical protein ACIBKX_32720 [Streptomyces sp. NPDC050658]|uniref:hypothetical protein n=1 Tax=unclassified Streptomyces TaxID=2593676 RepID=UPI003437FFE7